MPHETIQYPSMSNPASEIQLSWSNPEAGGHVQLRVEQHVWSDERCKNGCTDFNEQAADDIKQGCTDCPPPSDPIPIGSIRVSDDGHVARKDDDGFWNIWRREGGAVEPVSEDQVKTWRLVWADNGPVPGVIWTEVLERSHINKFIRTLRRARDAAYGKDE